MTDGFEGSVVDATDEMTLVGACDDLARSKAESGSIEPGTSSELGAKLLEDAEVCRAGEDAVEDGV